MNEEPYILCHCGQKAHRKSNSLIYGKEYGNGRAYICDNWPECTGSIGTHPDGKPLGTIGDKETQQLRRMCHSIIDPLWQEVENGRSRKRNRGSVYGWIQRITGLSPAEAHIGMMDAEDCRRLLRKIVENPYVVHGEPPRHDIWVEIK